MKLFLILNVRFEACYKHISLIAERCHGPRWALNDDSELPTK